MAGRGGPGADPRRAGTAITSHACARRSRLPAFVKVARTIRHHLGDIVAYVRYRLTNGIVEGLNNKLRVITHRAYGFHSASALIAMIMLCCTNISIGPPRIWIRTTSLTRRPAA